jgi:UDP-N-acetylglucosamine:LPS N-acetylglucosamine transferase
MRHAERGARPGDSRPRRLKICLVSSSGGHLNQLLLLKDIWQQRDHFFVTLRDYVVDELREHSSVYVLEWANRNHPVKLLKLVIRCLAILLRERPDVILSTGAAVGCLMCVVGKSLGKKVIWVDTVSHVESLTLSGKIVRHFADVFLVQWPELEQKYRDTEYVGSII